MLVLHLLQVYVTFDAMHASRGEEGAFCLMLPMAVLLSTHEHNAI